MIEGGTPNTLLRRGLTRDLLLKVNPDGTTTGAELIVDGYQTKDHSLKRANGRDVTFTDGRKMFMGSSGTGAPTDGRDPTREAEEAARSLRGSEVPGFLGSEVSGFQVRSSWYRRVGFRFEIARPRFDAPVFRFRICRVAESSRAPFIGALELFFF